MNCLAHAIRFLDDEWFMIGTGCRTGWAWLTVKFAFDRSTSILLSKLANRISRRMCLGIRQHWEDDDWFHTTAGSTM